MCCKRLYSRGTGRTVNQEVRDENKRFLGNPARDSRVRGDSHHPADQHRAPDGDVTAGDGVHDSVGDGVRGAVPRWVVLRLPRQAAVTHVPRSEHRHEHPKGMVALALS